MVKSIDLNCDLGEGFPFDEQLMEMISSCNIACGGHYGDEGSIRKAVCLARQNGVRVGAHPSFPDQKNFGRALMQMDNSELLISLKEQLKIIYAICVEEGVELNYVKPHGALYNLAAISEEVALVIVEAVKSMGDFALMGLPGSELEKICSMKNVPFIPESFADRRYDNDAKLLSRKEPNAVMHNPHEVVEQVLNMVVSGRVKTAGGSWKSLSPQSICVHGDNENALELVKIISKSLKQLNINIRSDV